MLVVRWAVMLLLLAAAVLFAFYAGTGNPRYKRLGWILLKWTLIATVGFMLVLFAIRMLE